MNSDLILYTKKIGINIVCHSEPCHSRALGPGNLFRIFLFEILILKKRP
ncbi:MAG: hypothetical protein LBQ59_02795 [Candidatus Peribacteria bacterium]|nr:hypothetical protein [Candidatus Peribacteria bacterium]